MKPWFENENNIDTLKEMNVKIQKAIISLWAILGYGILYFAFRYIFQFIPDIQPWGMFNFHIILFNFIYLTDIIYFVVGLIFYTYGALRLAGISSQNHTVRDEKTRKPDSLLTDGYYREVRHPMYGAFILLQASFLFSLRSLICLLITVIIIIVQNINAVHEEKQQLIPMFGDEYTSYMHHTKARFATKYMFVYLIIAVTVSCIGLLFFS